MATKSCPWCAEEIQAEAIKCRWCGSLVEGGLRDPREWHRGFPDRKLAGVCAAIAHNLRISVSAVRVGAVLLALVHGIGLVLYGLLWLVLPDGPGGRSPLERLAEAVRSLLGGSGSRGPGGRAARGNGEDRTSDAWNPTRS